MKNDRTLQNERYSVQCIVRSSHFISWLEKQDKRIQEKVVFRLERIVVEGHFGFTNYFDGIIELKWKSGLRIYLTRLKAGVVVVLLGGTKNGQNKDIKRAKKLLKEIKESYIIPL